MTIKGEEIMNFTELKTNMYAAMKTKDKVRKDVLATIIDNSKKIAIEKGVDRENVSEDIITAVILKEKKTLEEILEFHVRFEEKLHTLRKKFLDSWNEDSSYVVFYSFNHSFVVIKKFVMLC